MFKRKQGKAVLAVVGVLTLGFAGLGIASAVAHAAGTVSVAVPSNIYGCVTGSARTLEHVYANQQDFINSGGCPSGTWPITAVVGNAPAPPSSSGVAASPSSSGVAASPSSSGVAAPPTSPGITASPSSSGVACITSANSGSCPYANAFNVSSNNSGAQVIQDVWHPVDIVQKLTAYSTGDWSFTATATGTAVQSYPDTQQTMSQSTGLANPLTPDVSSSYTETSPSAGDFESAYDIWLGSLTNGSGQYNQEIMIWTDNHGQTPAGKDTGKSAVIGGVTYEIWATPNNSTVTMVAGANALSGSLDITTAITDLQSDGNVAAGEGYSQIDYGYEICSTGGSPETFGVSAYTLTS